MLIDNIGAAKNLKEVLLTPRNNQYVHIDFTKIVICQILIGLLGAIVDVSISISSSMNEVYKNNLTIRKNELLKSGLNIGKDILGTMTNTLLFAYIGGFMTLIIYFNELHYSITDIIKKCSVQKSFRFYAVE